MPSNIPPTSNPVSKAVAGPSGSAPARKAPFTGGSSAVVSKVEHGQHGLKPSPGSSLKSLGIRKEVQEADAKPSAQGSGQHQAEKIPAWKLKQLARVKARQEVEAQHKMDRASEVESATQVTGTVPDKNEIEAVFNLVQNMLLDLGERTNALTKLMSRPEADRLFMNFIGSDLRKLDGYFKFEQKSLGSNSDTEVRQIRLQRLIPYFSTEQINAAIDHHGFRSLMADTQHAHDEGGCAKVLVHAMSVPQFEAFVLAMSSKKQAAAVMVMVDKLGPDSPDLGEKLHAVLRNFNSFDQDVKREVLRQEASILPKIRHVPDPNMRAELNALKKGVFNGR